MRLPWQQKKVVLRFENYYSPATQTVNSLGPKITKRHRHLINKVILSTMVLTLNK